MPRQNQRGGILLNLTVTFGIIALIATISLPYLKKYQPNLKLNATARDLTSDLRLAQQLTITEQKVHLIKFNQLNSRYDLLRLDGAATTTVKNIKFDPEIKFKQITGLADDQAVFNYYGGVSQPGQIILININNITAVINLKPSGYVQLEN